MHAGKPLRVSVIGIDGSGKSSTAMRAIRELGTGLRVLQPGRNPFLIEGGRITPCASRRSRFFEWLFRRADATRSRFWIGVSRLLFVLHQGWLEPRLVRRLRPDLVVSTRCMVLDPAIYASFYFPRLDRMLSPERKLRAARFVSRLPLGDLYILLDTPPAAAMERIHRRIAAQRGAEPRSREHWLHLHEEEEALSRLGERFADTLTAARRLSPFELVEIDTTRHGEEEVARLIARGIRSLLARVGAVTVAAAS